MQQENNDFVDLTQLLAAEMSYFPGTEPFQIAQEHSVQEHGYMTSKIHMESHHGTHIDAPCHFIQGGRTIDQIRPEEIIGDAYVLNMNQPRQKIVQELLELQKYSVGVLLVRTNFSKHWNTPNYLGEFPALDAEMAQIIIQKGVKCVGVDAVSIDRMDSQDYQVHYKLLGADRIVIENLTNLDKLEGHKWEVFALPLKIKGCDGSPARVIARRKTE